MPFLEEDRTILFHVPHPSGIERKLGLSILRIGKGKARPLYWRSMTKKDTYTLKFVVEGSGGIQTRSGQLSFSKGDVVFFRKGQTYTWWTHPQDLLSHYWIDLDGPQVEVLFATLPENTIVLRRDEMPQREIDCLEQLMQLYEDPAEHTYWGALALFFQLWQSLDQSWAERRKQAPTLNCGSHLLAQRAKAFIDAHFAEDVRLAEIAKSVSVTPEYLSAVFRNAYGISPYEYVIQCRLNAATRLLRKGASVKEAAASVGYLDASYFSRLYRKKRGSPPSTVTQRARRSRVPGA